MKKLVLMVVALAAALMLAPGASAAGPPKVTLCHNPGANQQTLEVSIAAVLAHVAHGDYLGVCRPIDDGDGGDEGDGDGDGDEGDGDGDGDEGDGDGDGNGDGNGSGDDVQAAGSSSRKGYCMPYPVLRSDGTFGIYVNLVDGQPSWDPEYADATPALVDENGAEYC
jgi:hypothetical protein